MYNILTIKTLSGYLVVPAANMEAVIELDDVFVNEGGTPPPESWLGHELKLNQSRRARSRALGRPLHKPASEDLVLKELRWEGDFSGATWLTRDESVLARFLGLTTGSADFLVLWEDGEMTGLSVKNGVWELMSVEIKLVPQHVPQHVPPKFTSEFLTTAAHFAARETDDDERRF